MDEARGGFDEHPEAGARDLLLKGERDRFLAEEWPRVHATIQRLGLKPKDLLKPAKEER